MSGNIEEEAQKLLYRSLSQFLDTLEFEPRIICFGTGGSAQDFVDMFGANIFCYALDNNAEKYGEKFNGLDIFPPSKLIAEENPDRVLIIINSSFQVEICKQLESLGFGKRQHQINGLAFTLNLPGKMLKLRRGTSLTDFFSSISDINYCVIRSWEELPHQVPDWDVDIFISPEGYSRLLAVEAVSDDPLDAGLGIECYESPWDYDNGDLVYFPDYISSCALNNKILYKGLLNVPDDYHSLILMAHTCLYLKSPAKTGLNLDNKYNFHSKYIDCIQNLSERLQLAVELTGRGLQKFLRDEKFEAPLDWARYVEIKRSAAGEDTGWLPELLRASRRYEFSELIVIVIRTSAFDQGVRDIIVHHLKNDFGLKLNGATRLGEEQKTLAKKVMRSGNWGESESGGPEEIITFIDSAPQVSSDSVERRIYPYRNNLVYFKKNELRERLTKYSKGILNFFHSPDDEREAIEYLSVLSSRQLSDHYCSILTPSDSEFFLQNRMLDSAVMSQEI